jgi:hypothetical protein
MGGTPHWRGRHLAWLQAAAKTSAAERERCAAIVERWNAVPTHDWSPAVSTALKAGYRWLDIYCGSNRHRALIRRNRGAEKCSRDGAAKVLPETKSKHDTYNWRARIGRSISSKIKQPGAAGLEPSLADRLQVMSTHLNPPHTRPPVQPQAVRNDGSYAHGPEAQ